MGIIDEMLEQALFDGVVNCPTCQSDLEPDYDVCPHCKVSNPLRKGGFI